MRPRQIATFAIGPIGGAVLGVITVPLITWFFSQENVGRMAMLQVSVSFSVVLFSLGLDQAYVREFHQAEDKAALLKSVALPGLTLLIAVLSSFLFLGGSLSNLLFDISQWHLNALIATALLASLISRFLSLVLRMHERGLAYSMTQLLPKLLLVIMVGTYIVIEANKSLTNLVLAYTASIVFICLIYAWNTREEWLPAIYVKVELDSLKGMLRFGLPLILGSLAYWGLTAIDKVFLRGMASFEELALYSVAVSFASAAAILQSVFSTVWAPTVYKWASTKQGLENVHTVSRYVLALVVLGFALAGLFSWVVRFLIPDEYAAVQWLLVSCIGFPLLYTLSETTVVGIGISRRSTFSMLASIIAFVVCLIGNWWLIPIYGAAGAAVSTCVAFWVFFFLRTEFSIYLWEPIPRGLLYIYTLISVAGAVVFTLWGKKLGGLMIGYWATVLASCFFVFRNEWREAYKFVRKAVS